MELLTIIMSQSSKDTATLLLNELYAGLSRLHKDGRTIELMCDRFEQFSQITICGKRASQLRLPSEALSRAIGDVLADYILEHEEMNLIRKIITREYQYDQPEHIERIAGYCRQYLFAAGENVTLEKQIKKQRKEKIAAQVASYIKEYRKLHIDGFIAFRLQDYMEDLRESVEYAIDEFQMDQQYQEFISLLKYFVYIQEAKIPAAHLLHKGGNEFAILNDRLVPISTDEIDGTFKLEVLDRNTNFEDVIVSTLITVSPGYLFIHTSQPELQVIQTIAQIFENRVNICEGCHLCAVTSSGKKDQLSP